MNECLSFNFKVFPFRNHSSFLYMHEKWFKNEDLILFSFIFWEIKTTTKFSYDFMTIFLTLKLFNRCENKFIIKT